MVFIKLVWIGMTSFCSKIEFFETIVKFENSNFGIDLDAIHFRFRRNSTYFYGTQIFNCNF